LGGPDKIDTKISIDLAGVLAFPSRVNIEACKGAGAGSTAISSAFDCLVARMPDPSLKALSDCGRIAEDHERALCLLKGGPQELASLAPCLQTRGEAGVKLEQCTPVAVWAKVQNAQNCIGTASRDSVANCLLENPDPSQKALVSCLSSTSNQADVALHCLTESNPEMAGKIAVVECATKAADTVTRASCFTQAMGGDAGMIAQCATGEKDKLISCVLGDKPEYQPALQIVACVQKGQDAGSLIANCSDFFVKDAKTRSVLACVAGAASDNGKLANCAVSSVLPPAIAHYAACAATSQGATLVCTVCGRASHE